MSFQANVLRVMIASPGDVAEERRIVTEEIYRWNDANAFVRKLVLLPVKWETHSTPQLGAHPQTIINRQLLDDADIVVAIFGTRIGTPTEEYVSGTVEEIKKHVAAGKIAKIYFSDVPVPPSSMNASQYAALQQFREECQRTGLYATFDSTQQLRTDFGLHLNLELNQPRYLWLTAPIVVEQSSTTALSRDALHLIRAASCDDGTVILEEGLDNVKLTAGNEQFMDGSSRSAAKWRTIVRDLVNQDILEFVSEGVYRLSAMGYDIADKSQDSEENSVPTEVSLNVAGPPEGQYLDISSSRIVRLTQLDFLTSTDACISSQPLSEEGKEIQPKFVYEKVTELFNSPRHDRSNYDRSGPAKLRLSLCVGDHSHEVILPVMLQPKYVNNTNWVTLAGSRRVQLPT